MGLKERLNKIWQSKITCSECKFVHFEHYQEIEHSNIHTIDWMNISEQSKKVLLEINDYIDLSSSDSEDFFNKILGVLGETERFFFKNWFTVEK